MLYYFRRFRSKFFYHSLLIKILLICFLLSFFQIRRSFFNPILVNLPWLWWSSFHFVVCRILQKRIVVSWGVILEVYGFSKSFRLLQFNYRFWLELFIWHELDHSSLILVENTKINVLVALHCHLNTFLYNSPLLLATHLRSFSFISDVIHFITVLPW